MGCGLRLGWAVGWVFKVDRGLFVWDGSWAVCIGVESMYVGGIFGMEGGHWVGW